MSEYAQAKLANKIVHSLPQIGLDHCILDRNAPGSAPKRAATIPKEALSREVRVHVHVGQDGRWGTHRWKGSVGGSEHATIATILGEHIIVAAKPSFHLK